MPNGGVVISVKDEDNIPVYLSSGVYGLKLRLGPPDDPNLGPYVRALEAYASCRRDDHVFFHTGDRFVYAGRVRGSDRYGAFHLNGRRGFLGRRAAAPLVWGGTAPGPLGTHSQDSTDITGRRRISCPFLLRFGDYLGLAGRWVDGHSVYLSLGDYPHLLPITWTRSRMISISPGETKRLLSLFVEDSAGCLPAVAEMDSSVSDEAVPYDPRYGPNYQGANTTEGLTAALLAHPFQLPSLRPPAHAVIAHQVPISPYRPSDVPTVDVAWYTDQSPRDGTIPDVLLFVSVEPAGLDLARRIERQHAWLERLIGAVGDVEIKAVAPEFTHEFGESVRDGPIKAVDEVRITLNRSGL